MKADQFKEIIKKLVKDEVRREIKNLISEEVKREVNRILVEALVESHGKKTIVSEQKLPPKPAPRNPIIKTGNPELDKILAETRFSPEERKLMRTESPVSLESPFRKINAEDPGVEIPNLRSERPTLDSLKSIVSTPLPSSNQEPCSLDYTPALPEFLQKAFTKNYKSLLESVDEKRKSGNLNFGLVGQM